MTDRVKARNKKRLLVAFVFWLVGASGANAQSPASLFRQRPAPVQSGAHGTSAHSADVDTGMLMTGPDKLWLVIPGRPDLLVERDSHQPRGARRGVWRGRAQFEPNSRVIITYHDGMVAGHIQLGKDSYAIHPRTGGRIVLEKNNPDSFKPEWGHEHATHGRDKVPPAGTQGGESGSGSTSATTTSASSVNSTADAANEIRLLSVYTPQARAAAGGTTQIEAKIQAAVDQANTAFIDSNMTARFILGHMQEVAYNDTGNIETDLNWVTGNSSVASLRNTHGADMVSLIVANGGSYCGIAWVQRNPGSGFASYAFQVTDSDCLANHTFAHEHGHNMGFEHNPENSSVGKNPSQASYDWSFGHWVNGQFRTVMSYNACSSTCPRLLQFSNPDIAVN